MVNVKNSTFLQNARIKDEVFSIMRPDDKSEAVKNDTLICMYGETLLSKHKRKQIINVISNKMRELGRLLITLKKSYDIKNLFDALKPELFNYLILATKEISGYSVESKSFKSPSLALHTGSNLKTVCDVAYKLVLEKKRLPGIEWIDQKIKKIEIKDLRKLIEGHWCNELSSLALKTLKEKHWEKPLQLPLAKCILAKTVIFNRKRVGDVQYLTVETYGRNYDTLNQESFTEALTEVEKIIYKNYRRFVTGGKGSKPVPILFSFQTQKYISLLLKVRQETNVVPETNPYLFANPDSEDRWMSGANTIRKIAINCGAKHPELLTSTRFRKQIATTLQLLALDDDEMEQIATFMGHTKKTHTEFNRLPQDIYQTAKVAKILLLMEKGKGNRYRGKK
ncbi:uncharacterized protein LOC126883628 [Diabrotica virgifera virgifera]|uniref:Uncharacterized protein n=1 Tax=Diabrotica virgifera virgifera TaxID=50390 RepID=A0ABM5K4X0_DIAVI|nr:uncharacterized protein LOC126883628 [Diabrotica virgifera virgifera]